MMYSYFSGVLVGNRIVKIFLIVSCCSFLILLYSSNLYGTVNYKSYKNIYNVISHNGEVQSFLEKRRLPTTSNLGGILFNFEDVSKYAGRQNRTYSVLIWKYFGWLKNRHVYNYGSSIKEDTLEDCSVKNCIFSGDDELLNTADAVLIHLQKGEIPDDLHRNPKQRWIFLNDESPRNAFSLSGRWRHWSDYINIFNWSMTYRSDADVPVPYGRTVPLVTPITLNMSNSDHITEMIPFWDNKRYDVLATVLMSNCGVKRRMDILKELRNHMVVDIYGKCADNNTTKNSCPGHFRSDCHQISEYLFYLVLENSMCSQYLTEKIFYHAYTKGAIPVVFGPSMEDCESLLPPNSYLYADEKSDIEQLAQYMLKISQDTNLLLSFHTWRNNFKVVNEHGYFGTRSYHLCRLCEALNYNDETPKVYGRKELQQFLDPVVSCD